MSEGLFLALAIPLAAAVLSLAAAIALYDSRAPVTRSEAPAFVRTRLLCPLSHELTSADVGVAQRPRRVTVLRCERFPDGPPQCGRACFPEFPVPEGDGVHAHAA